MSIFSDLVLALPSLRFAYPLDAAGTTDVGPSGLTLTANSAPGTTSPGPAVGYNATSYNGTSQSHSRAHNAAFDFGTGDMTFGCFIKPTDTGAGSRFFLCHDGDGGGNRWEMFQSGTQLSSRFNAVNVDAAGVLDTSWQFVALVLDRDGNGRWWRNGDWAAAGTSIAAESAAAFDYTGSLWIGRRESTGYWTGSMAWAFGCAAALTSTQLLALYNASSAMAVVETVASTGSTDNTTTIDIAKPTGTEEGDLLVAWVYAHESGSTHASCTGWTHITHSVPRTLSQGCLLWKVAGPSEGTPYTFDNNIAGGDDTIGGMLRISGVDTSDPIAIYADSEVTATTGTTINPPSSGTVDAGDYLAVAFFGLHVAAGASTPPSGFAEWIDLSSGMTIAAAALPYVAVTSVDPGVFTFGSTTFDGIAATLLIRPAGAPIPLTTVRPDADTTTTGWTTTPLWSKIEETSADGTVITATSA